MHELRTDKNPGFPYSAQKEPQVNFSTLQLFNFFLPRMHELKTDLPITPSPHHPLSLSPPLPIPSLLPKYKYSSQNRY